MIKGSSEYLGLNPSPSDLDSYAHFGGWLKSRLVPFSAPGWDLSHMGWGINPDGLKLELLNINDNYEDPRILVTEYGYAAVDRPDENGYVRDHDRIRYLRAHIIALHEAMQQGAKVNGYFVWSILDNFEWERGYSKTFGLVRVDPKTLNRIPKLSASWYREVIKNQGVNP